jgi:hypothetical protein
MTRTDSLRRVGPAPRNPRKSFSNRNFPNLKANIPNYHLSRGYKEIAALQAITPLTIRTSLESLWLNLWHEQRNKMVSFGAIKTPHLDE